MAIPSQGYSLRSKSLLDIGMRPFIIHIVGVAYRPATIAERLSSFALIILVEDNMAAKRRLDVSESANVSVVRFKDEKIIDPETIQELGEELFDLVEKEERKKLVLNFASVEFLSSAALGKLITFEKKAKRVGAELMLTNISPEIYQVFAITNLDKLFQIKDTEADALALL